MWDVGCVYERGYSGKLLAKQQWIWCKPAVQDAHGLYCAYHIRHFEAPAYCAAAAVQQQALASTNPGSSSQSYQAQFVVVVQEKINILFPPASLAGGGNHSQPMLTIFTPAVSNWNTKG